MTIQLNNIEPAPVVLFVYNRPWHTEQTLKALKSNELADQSILYIFCDGPKNEATQETLEDIEAVRKLVHSQKWCKEEHIIESPVNKGLANSIISGVSQVISQYGKVIVLEDDLVTHRFFLRFMNESLQFYSKDKRIFSIGGTNYAFPIPRHYKGDIYIVQRTESWGWGTWQDRWEKADWKIKDFKALFADKKEIKKFNRGGNDLIKLLQLQIEGKIDSWAILWDYFHYKNESYCVRPVNSLIRNTGCDGTGIHCGILNINSYLAKQYDDSDYSISLVNNIVVDDIIEKNFKAFFGDDINHLTWILLKTKRLLIKIKIFILKMYRHFYDKKFFRF